MFAKKVGGYAREVVRQSICELVGNPVLKRSLDTVIEAQWRVRAQASGNPLLQHGRKFYSQNDEDGILGAILERLGLETGVFVEYGCGDGLENNTIHLLMRGWTGVWIGSTDLKIRIPPSTRSLRFEQQWVTRDNCVEIMNRGRKHIGAGEANLISVDLDGNDWFVVEELLKASAAVDVVIVEYNGKFPPPVRFTIEYDPAFVQAGTDYFGASLQSFVDLFDRYGFRLVCCNVTGANAFFVAGRHAAAFADVADDTRTLFMPPDYTWFVQVGHSSDPRSIERFLL